MSNDRKERANITASPTEPDRLEDELPPTQPHPVPPTEDRIAISVPAPPRDRATLTMIVGPEPGSIFTIERNEALLGRGMECSIRIDDPGVSRRHARLTCQGQDYFLEDLGSRNGTLVDGLTIRSVHQVREGDRIGLGATVRLRFALADEVEERCQKLVYESSVLDALTGTHNRRHFYERLADELAFARRHEQPLSILLLDIDRFKTVNDRMGHLGGDFALKSVSDLIRKTLRAEDFLARYGGEEFVVLARGIDLAQTAAMAERLRKVIESAVFKFDDASIPLTVSIGVASLASFEQHVSIEELVGLADRQLYIAKNNGRNRVECALG